MNAYPKLHNAMWPGLVGKGPDSEPPIDLDTMLDLTAKASIDSPIVKELDAIRLHGASGHVVLIDDIITDGASKTCTVTR